jgi:inward rectifier potassium channel
LAKAPKRKDLLRTDKIQVVRFGRREVETSGLPQNFWTDLYHRSMTVYWPVFFATAAAIFIILNAVFAFFYWLGDDPVANVVGNRALGLFYFSIETLATVGYGDMHPQTNYGHLIATVESFTGMSFLAVMTGLIFARFSLPRARFLFAEHPVVAIHQGQPTLMIRVANVRNNTISQATARLWLFRLETTLEGGTFRRYHELLLDRHEHPMFMLGWTLFHTIDETSPLYRVGPDDLAAVEASFTLNVSGIDDISAQLLHAREVYSHRDIRWKYRYRDITSTSERGRLLIDYAMFHEIVPE